VKTIVEQLGGQIGFDSEPGQGATFHVTLPIRHEVPVVSDLAFTDQVQAALVKSRDSVEQLLANVRRLARNA
jgi:hypothetical protein